MAESKSPIYSLPLETFHEVFSYLPHNEVFVNVSSVSRELNAVVQTYTVYLPALRVNNPSANLLRSLEKKLSGCGLLTISFGSATPSEEEEAALIRLIDKIAHTIRECHIFSSAYCPSEVISKIIEKGSILKHLRTPGFPADDADISTNSSLESLQVSNFVFRNPNKVLKKIPNLRAINATFQESQSWEGFNESDGVNVKLLVAHNFVPIVFVHVEELVFTGYCRRALSQSFFHYLPMLTSLTKLTISLPFMYFNNVRGNFPIVSFFQSLFALHPNVLSTVYVSLKIQQPAFEISPLQILVATADLMTLPDCFRDIWLMSIRFRPYP